MKGPPAVRNKQFPMGIPGLRGRLASRLQQSNAMFMFALRRLEWRIKNWGFAVLEHPRRSWGWLFSLALSLLRTKGIFFTVVWNCCHGGRRKKAAGLLYNIPHLHHALHAEDCQGHQDGELLSFQVHEDANGSLHFDTEEEAEYPFNFCWVYAGAIKAAVREWSLMSIPVTLSIRSQWVENMLLHCATKLLARQSITDEIMPTLFNLLNSMVPGACSCSLDLCF